METENEKKTIVHQGENVRKLRGYEGMKQFDLADKMGVTQQFVSKLERQPVIAREYMERIADALKVAPEVIENMEETPVSVVVENNTFENGSGSTNIGYSSEYNDSKVIHPIEKLLELTKENASLYERMVANEKDKAALLEKLLNEKK